MEQWKEIPENKKYSVSNLGRVRNNYAGNKQIKPSLNSHGYTRVKISGKTIRVHILVAKAFIPNPENKPEVNHKDGDKTNNRVDNLEWATRSENETHARKNNLKNSVSIQGTANVSAILTEPKVAEIKRLRSEGKSIRFLSKQFNVNVATIHNIITGKSWKHV